MGKRKKLTERTLENALKAKSFRVAVFGSARIKKNDEIYKNVFDLAKKIGEKKFHLVTGGGPGLMEAANAGHSAGDPKDEADNIGLLIKLPWEPGGNVHLEIQKEFDKFSGRLDKFIALSNVMVVVPGGVGTLLELSYAWQLVQVKHIQPVQIILIGEMWEEFVKWIEKYPLKKGLICEKDMDCIHVVKNNEEAMKLIEVAHEGFKQGKNVNEPYLLGK